MPLKPNDFHDCYAESAELYESKPDEHGRTSLSLKVDYRFPVTGQVITHYHCLVKKDGTLNTDKSGVPEVDKLQTRYGIDLSTFEVDNTKFTPEIVVRAFVKEEEFKGKTRLVIDGIYDNGKKEGPDRAALARRFGSTLRAVKRPAAPTVSAPNAAPPKGAAAKATPPTPKAPPAAPKGKQGAEKAVEPSDLNEVWSHFLSVHKDLPEGQREDAWFAFLKETWGHSRQESATPEEWGVAKAKLVDMEDVPF